MYSSSIIICKHKFRILDLWPYFTLISNNEWELKWNNTCFCYSFADRVRWKFVQEQKFANGNTAVQRTTPVGFKISRKCKPSIFIRVCFIQAIVKSKFHEMQKKIPMFVYSSRNKTKEVEDLTSQFRQRDQNNEMNTKK